MGSPIKYINGDVTAVAPPFILLQIVNNVGAYGAGVSGAIAGKWSFVEQVFRKLHAPLGETIHVTLGIDMQIFMLVAQNGLRSMSNPVSFSLQHFNMCLTTLSKLPIDGPKFIMPRMGAGLAGGNWDRDIAPAIERILPDHEKEVYSLCY